MISSLGDLTKLEQNLVKEKVTHLAVLRNWFEVVNVNPLFQTNEATPEIMEVFEFNPAHMHFTSKDVGTLTAMGRNYLARGDTRDAISVLRTAVRYDPRSSRAHNYLGWALLMSGQLDAAEMEIKNALHLHSTYWEARLGMAQVLLRRNHPQEAVTELRNLVQMNPRMVAAYQTLEQIYAQLGDTASARWSREQFQIEQGKTGQEY